MGKDTFMLSKQVSNSEARVVSCRVVSWSSCWTPGSAGLSLRLGAVEEPFSGNTDIRII